MSALRRLFEMLSPPDGLLYRDAHYLSAEVTLDETRASAWVPRPLLLRPGATATVFAAWFPHTSFGSTYREVGVLLPVRHRRADAVYSPWMLVDDDVALITGRELLGYPKKLGEVQFEREGDTIRASASRRGVELLRFEAELGPSRPDAPPILGREHRNVRSALGVAVPWLVSFRPEEHAIEVREAHVRLTVSGSERDPLSELGLGAVTRGFLHRVNLAASPPPRPVGVVAPWVHASHVLRRSW